MIAKSDISDTQKAELYAEELFEMIAKSDISDTVNDETDFERLFEMIAKSDISDTMPCFSVLTFCLRWLPNPISQTQTLLV